MKTLKIAYYITPVILLTVGIWMNWFSDYMRFRDVDVVVVSKMVVPGRSGGLSMVFKDEKGMFDRSVNATTYTQFNAGDKAVLSIREFDIRQDLLKNVIWLFIPIVMEVIGGMWLISILGLGLARLF